MCMHRRSIPDLSITVIMERKQINKATVKCFIKTGLIMANMLSEIAHILPLKNTVYVVRTSKTVKKLRTSRRCDGVINNKRSEAVV